MKNENLKLKGEELNQLACKVCTKNWISDQEKDKDPITIIINCFGEGLISLNLKERLIKEIEEIKNER